MEDFGQLIAIIVGVVLLAINALGKKKKPIIPPQNNKTSTPSVPRTRTGIPELDMFLEEISEHPEEVEHKKPILSPTYETLETIEPDSPYREFSFVDYRNEGNQNANYIKLGEDNTQKTNDNLDVFEDSKQREFNNNFEFNLRDAIIFSEILKRPSY